MPGRNIRPQLAIYTAANCRITRWMREQTAALTAAFLGTKYRTWVASLKPARAVWPSYPSHHRHIHSQGGGQHRHLHSSDNNNKSKSFAASTARFSIVRTTQVPAPAASALISPTTAKRVGQFDRYVDKSNMWTKDRTAPSPQELLETK